ncbi:hypothetical protein JCM18918_219 [Cutibacterium acnes JCM 18918]|nr:hypothetical protein JCM18918_219 [Cutibacterium acnes JCM 18918]
MNDNEEDLDSTIRHAKALTWVCVALFVVLDVIGLTAPSQSDPRFVLGGLWWGRVLLGYHWRGCLVGLLGSQRRARAWTTVSIVNSTSRTMPGAMTGVSRRPSSLSP